MTTTEQELQTKLVVTDKYKEWITSLVQYDWLIFEMQNNGFQLHHLVGKYYGYLDSDMTIASLATYVGVSVDINIISIYKEILKKINETTTS